MSGRKIIEGMYEALEYTSGKRVGSRTRRISVPEQVDVRAIRERLSMTQKEFAVRYGFPLDTVQNWEQGRRKPEGAARVLLRLIETDPESVEKVLVG
jgi:putative transcriptional regulator